MSTNPSSDITKTFSLSSGPPITANKLLAALPAEVRQRLQAQLALVPLRHKQVLQKQGHAITDVYFPCGGACSLMRTMEDGGSAEIATIGSEGIVNVCVYFGQDVAIGDVIIQIEDGGGFKMTAPAFAAEMNRRDAFHDLVVRYSQAMTSHVMLSVACNALHQVEQRACRWLLISADRVGGHELKLTHEFLSIMLGVRRPTVTLVIGELEKAGLVENHRGSINIVDRAKLEEVSCECYAAAKANFARLLPEIARPVG
jgi:CRP-like cAMP-binding protein